MRARWLGLALGLLAFAPLQAGRLYQVAGDSSVSFTASTSLHAVEGRTHAVKGRVRFDPAAPLDAKGKVLIDARTLETGNSARDRDLRNEVLEAEAFPRIALAMKRFVAPEDPALAQPMQGNIHALLEIRGQVQKLAIPARVQPRAGGRLAIQGDVDIDMTRWGVQPPRKGPIRVDPKVQVAFRLELEPLE